MKRCIILLCMLSSSWIAAQIPLKEPHKVSLRLNELKNTLRKDVDHPFFVLSTNPQKFVELLVIHGLERNIVAEYQPSNLFVISLKLSILDSLIVPSSLVSFVDIRRKPFEESVIDDFDLGTNKINRVHAEFTTLDGSGTVVSVKENRPDSNDLDLRGRFSPTTLASTTMTSHATMMSTIIAGAGNSSVTGKGVAWAANLTSSNFASLLPDPDGYYKTLGISVQNHSYGTGIENYYGADAAAYDASTTVNPSLVHVFSAGNAGDKASVSGPYTGTSAFANITGSFKMAKNVITVAAIDSFYNVPLLSSRGPAYDGRLSPSISAFGLDGTSGAAALVSGAALLVQQAYKEKNGGHLPASSLVKTILLNSADDIARKGIDFESGYGSLNAYRAIQTVLHSRYFSGSVSAGGQQTFRLHVPANSGNLKITICWNDVPATANHPEALINDLDLQLVHTSTGNSWDPWVLNSYPHEDSLRQLPTRRKDRVNNSEQITIDTPLEGEYIIEVSGYRIPLGSQSFYISYQWDSTNKFEWEFPSSIDRLYANRTNIVRWQSSFVTPTAKLFYSLNQGSSWILASDKIDLPKSQYRWPAPDNFATVIFKMEINGSEYVSDTATISSRLNTSVGFNCNDSFSFFWNQAPNISSYTVFVMGDKYLQPVRVTSDTSVTFKKEINGHTHYSVSPNIRGKSGINSYTFNYSTQGVGCYIKGFIVDLVNSSSSRIQLDLGTTYDVQDVVIEKFSNSTFKPLPGITNSSPLLYQYIDEKLTKGENRYRARILLRNGLSVYSQAETVYYLPDMTYLLYPNPASTYFQIVSKDPEDASLDLYNYTGQKVLQTKITSPVQKIPVNGLQKGLYFIVVTQKGKKVFTGNIFIQ